MIPLEQIIQQADLETAFLILTCRVYIETETKEALLSFLKEYDTSIDYKKVYQLAKRNRIRPVVYNVLSALPADTILLKKLEEDCRSVTLQGFRNLKEMEQIVALMESKGVALMPYRGALFSKMYYGDWVLRESSDIDFLVHPKNIPDILAFIKANNYHSAIAVDDYRHKYLHSNGLSIDVTSQEHKQSSIHLEFHYNISPACYAVAAHYTDFEKDRAFFKLNDRDIPVLSSTANAIMLLAHHGLNDIWVSIKYYLDIAVLLKRSTDIDWKEVKAFCERNGYYKLSAAGLHNTELLMGISNPFSVSDKEKSLANELFPLVIFPDRYRNRKWYKLYLRIKGRDTLLWKWKTIKGLCALMLTPSTEDFKWKYFPPHLFYLYYICKPARLFYKFLIQPLWGKKPEFMFR